jgi:hypothetical protein
MQESDVIERANALGVKAMSEKNIVETLGECMNLKNRFEDLDVSVGLYGLPHGSKIKQLRAQTDEVISTIRRELLQRREAKEFVEYR